MDYEKIGLKKFEYTPGHYKVIDPVTFIDVYMHEDICCESVHGEEVKLSEEVIFPLGGGIIRIGGGGTPVKGFPRMMGDVAVLMTVPEKKICPAYEAMLKLLRLNGEDV